MKIEISSTEVKYLLTALAIAKISSEDNGDTDSPEYRKYITLGMYITKQLEEYSKDGR